MPNQVLPITDLAKAGVIMDTPAVSLPPNVFSNVENVRFRDGAIRKMEGETTLFSLTPGADPIVYVAYWQGPFNNMYVVVREMGTIALHLASDPSQTRPGGSIETSADATYQHTLFNGGFNFVLNNGVSTPIYLTDVEDFNTITAFNSASLPNWNSYLAQENIVSVVWDNQNTDIPLGRSVSLNLETINPASETIGTQAILFRIIPRDPSLPILTQAVDTLVRQDDGMSSTYSVPTGGLFSIQDPTSPDNWLLNPTPRDTTVTPPIAGAEPGDTIEIAIQERPEIEVTAGVVRAYGSLLVAGNLRETSGNRIIRNLPGTIRTSDVAAPGNVPANWNPFRNGANTADEFTLSATGAVQDMAELQGNLYIYTTGSIHSLQQTGGNIPFGIRPVTNNYGADNLGSVLEVDGKHIVVGSDDIYVFAGHPGSITSIADSRVRHRDFFNSDTDVKILRYSRFDELWFYSPNVQEMFIWNYRDNTWSRREQTTPVVGNQGPGNLIFSYNTNTIQSIVYAIDPNSYTSVGINGGYISYIERRRLAITPEFTTENLVSAALLTELVDPDTEVVLDVSVRGSDSPQQDLNPTEGTGLMQNVNDFQIRDLVLQPDGTTIEEKDYKVDIRVHGRLLNYRIADRGQQAGWSIAGMQFDIGTGGVR